jgi:hypothetical protein
MGLHKKQKKDKAVPQTQTVPTRPAFGFTVSETPSHKRVRIQDLYKVGVRKNPFVDLTDREQAGFIVERYKEEIKRLVVRAESVSLPIPTMRCLFQEACDELEREREKAVPAKK